jgi:hypothetical protein
VIKHLLIISAFLLVGSYGFGQESKLKTIYYKQWGKMRFNKNVNCENSLQTKYGFSYKVVAGCIVKSSRVKRWNNYNYRMEQKMNKRHGEEWRKKYITELDVCVNNKLK